MNIERSSYTDEPINGINLKMAGKEPRQTSISADIERHTNEEECTSTFSMKRKYVVQIPLV
jgi:hypothetical protein